MPSIIADFKLDKYQFAAGHSGRNIDTYYMLADELAVHYLLSMGESKTDKQLEEEYSKLSFDVSEIVSNFYSACDQLITEVLMDLDWKISS